MRFTDDKTRETAYDIATEIVYGGDRFGVEDMQIYLDGIDKDNLASIRNHAREFARKMQPGITDEYLEGSLTAWTGLIRCDGDKVACKMLDEHSSERLCKALKMSYWSGFTSAHLDVVDDFNKTLNYVSQKDIDELIGKAYDELRDKMGSDFSENRFRNELNYILPGVQTAEFMRCRVAYQIEDPDSPSLYREDYDWGQKIADYVISNRWSVGKDLSEALDVLGERNFSQVCPPCDNGLSKLLVEPIQRELDYYFGKGQEVLLEKAVILEDGISYDRIVAEGTDVILRNDFGDWCVIDNVNDAMALGEWYASNNIDLSVSEKQKNQMAVGIALMDKALWEGEMQPDGSMRFNLPEHVVEGKTIVAVTSHEGFDGDSYFNLIYKEKDGREVSSIGFNSDRMMNYFRHLDAKSVEVYSQCLKEAETEIGRLADSKEDLIFRGGRDLDCGYVYDLGAAVRVDVEPEFGGGSLTVDRIEVDALHHLSVVGMSEGGDEKRTPMLNLDEKSIDNLLNRHELKVNWSETPSKLREAAQYFKTRL